MRESSWHMEIQKCATREGCTLLYYSYFIAAL